VGEDFSLGQTAAQHREEGRADSGNRWDRVIKELCVGGKAGQYR